MNNLPPPSFQNRLLVLFLPNDTPDWASFELIPTSVSNWECYPMTSFERWKILKLFGWKTQSVLHICGAQTLSKEFPWHEEGMICYDFVKMKWTPQQNQNSIFKGESAVKFLSKTKFLTTYCSFELRTTTAILM